jgi:hypothetical protein
VVLDEEDAAKELEALLKQINDDYSVFRLTALPTKRAHLFCVNDIRNQVYSHVII